MSQRNLFIFVGLWFAGTLAVSFSNEGWSTASLTRVLIIGFFLVELGWYYGWGRFTKIENPRRTFILFCTLSALAMELFYMVSRPLDMSLLITRDTPFWEAGKNILIDLVLTAPVYIIIFTIIWLLIKRYRYSAFAFFFVMSLGQALGDGGAFFIANPPTLILIPYIMSNYWAMNFVPFLLIRNQVEPSVKEGRAWEKILAPIILLPLTYFISAVVIITIGRAIGWLPG